MSDAHSSAVIKYNRSRDNIMIRPTKDEGAEIRQAAAAAGKSLQAYILDVLRDARTTQDNREPHSNTRDELLDAACPGIILQ